MNIKFNYCKYIRIYEKANYDQISGNLSTYAHSITKVLLWWRAKIHYNEWSLTIIFIFLISHSCRTIFKKKSIRFGAIQELRGQVEGGQKMTVFVHALSTQGGGGQKIATFCPRSYCPFMSLVGQYQSLSDSQ